jgi:hypothetical protein
MSFITKINLHKEAVRNKQHSGTNRSVLWLTINHKWYSQQRPTSSLGDMCGVRRFYKYSVRELETVSESRQNLIPHAGLGYLFVCQARGENDILPRIKDKDQHNEGINLKMRI